MTGPREWRHADICNGNEWRQINVDDPPCDCGLSAVRDAIAAGHRVVIGPDGVEGRVVADAGWETVIASDGLPSLRVRDDLSAVVPLEEP